MSKLVVSRLISLDGFFAGPGGDLNGLPMGHAFDVHNLDLLREADTLIFGRTTFELFKDFWPQVEVDDKSDPVMREISKLMRKMRKIVVSDSLKRDQLHRWCNTIIVDRGSSRAYITDLKATSRNGLLMYGSGHVWRDLMMCRQVDELHLLISNVVLGNGIALLESCGAREFTLLGQRRLPGSEILAIRCGV